MDFDNNLSPVEPKSKGTVFTDVESKLSGNLHLFCTQLCKGKKKKWKCGSEELFE